MTSSTIVVGYDGSIEADAALRWAVAEAGRRSAPVRLVYAVEGPRDDAAETMLREAVGEVSRVAATPLTTQVEQGPPAKILSGLPAGLVVVGARGTGAVGGPLLGSVVFGVVRHAAGPVVVVRGSAPAGQPAPGTAADRRPVLADPTGEVVLRTAFEQALGRGVPLLAVRAWSPPRPAARRDARRPGGPVREREAAAGRELAGVLRPWLERFPAVPVRTRILPGAAGHVLVAASRGAQLAVVGDGRGGPARIGSPVQQLLHHACCPVLLVPG